MLKNDFKLGNAIYVATIISILFAASGLRAEERLPVSETLAEKTKDYLSDPARTGSLLGSIIAGAALANPLAPLVGSVVGFFIGKSSDYSDKDSNAARRHAYINRSLIPDDGVQVTSLTGLTGKPPQASEHTVITGLSMKTARRNKTELTEQRVIEGFSGETGTTKRTDQSEQTFLVSSAEEDGIQVQSVQTEQTAALELTEETGSGSKLQQQLADACSNVQLAQPMSFGCYYYSQ